MKLTARLAFSQLKVNKRRTTWTFIGIMLASAMLTTIYGLGFGSGMDWLDRMLATTVLREPYFALIAALALVMSGFVITISVIVISNAFRVSASERIIQFGILKSVGATKKQIIQTVVYEGFYLTLIGIPVGIMIGLLVQWIGVGIINDVIEPLLSLEEQESGEYLMHFVWSWLALFLGFVVSFVTVFLSAWFPASKVARVSAIDSIRGVGEVQIKNKKVRGGAIIKKVFGFEGILARTFLKRSKRNFRATVIAMSFSIAIFIVAGGFYDQMNRFADIQWGGVDANVNLSVGLDANAEVPCNDDEYDIVKMRTFYDEGILIEQCFIRVDESEVMRRMDEFEGLHEQLGVLLNEGDQLIGIGEGSREYRTSILRSQLSSEMIPILEEWHGWGEGDYEFNVNLIVVDDVFAKALADLAGVPVGSNILVNQSRYWFNDGRVIEHEILLFDDQTLVLRRWGEDTTTEIELHGQLTPEQMPAELGHGWPNNLRIIVPETNLMTMHWRIQTDESAAVAEAGRELLEEFVADSESSSWVAVVDRDEMIAITRNTTDLVTFLTFTFVVVLIIIGLTNVISTISENVKSRSKEFAMLQSVGMTSGGIKRMLNLESVFSSIKALTIGIPIGILGAYGVFLAIGNVGEFGFLVPWTWVVTAVVGVFIITWVTMRFAANRLKGQNIIETIRSGSGM